MAKDEGASKVTASPVTTGLIGDLERMLGAPLSDASKEACELAIANALTVGVDLATKVLSVGANEATNAMLVGAGLANEQVKAGAQLAKNLLGEGSTRAVNKARGA